MLKTKGHLSLGGDERHACGYMRQQGLSNSKLRIQPPLGKQEGPPDGYIHWM
ncbi:hypothetical protein HBI94_106340 [Parastagonospora nodorum]|nr:hypothetical protein HBI94_106340 [Parastagonospora nodorum]